MGAERSYGSRLFALFNYAFLLAIAFLCVFPFIQIVGGSFATTEELIRKGSVIVPEHFSLAAYRFIFSDGTIPRSLLVTACITVCGTCINLALTATGAFALSRKALRGRNAIMFFIVFTMLFEGGLIPTYLVVKELQLINTYWAVMIPNAIAAFNLILMRNFFMQLPEELFESAKLDGCSDWKTFVKIVLPLSLASLATFTLFYAVGHWNNFFHAFLYLNDPLKWPIQIWLRNIIVLATEDFGNVNVEAPPQSVRMAVIVVATAPILLVYPFIQKHFAKGVMLGSVKG